MIIQQSYLKTGNKPQRVFELGFVVLSSEQGTRPLVGTWSRVTTLEVHNPQHTIEARNE